jgi:hypothetical protein
MLIRRAMTLAVHPIRVPPHVTRRSAILVALSIPLVMAQCAEEGARLREETNRGTDNGDHQIQSAGEEADDVTPDAR